MSLLPIADSSIPSVGRLIGFPWIWSLNCIQCHVNEKRQITIEEKWGGREISFFSFPFFFLSVLLSVWTYDVTLSDIYSPFLSWRVRPSDKAIRFSSFTSLVDSFSPFFLSSHLNSTQQRIGLFPQCFTLVFSWPFRRSRQLKWTSLERSSVFSGRASSSPFRHLFALSFFFCRSERRRLGRRQTQ